MTRRSLPDVAEDSGSIRLASARGRRVPAVVVLGESMTLPEATVVNVSLPSLGRDLGASFAGLQWILDGYVLTLAALMLLGGSLGDHHGRRRVLTVRDAEPGIGVGRGQVPAAARYAGVSCVLACGVIAWLLKRDRRPSLHLQLIPNKWLS
jgi:MFS family permease